MQKTLLKWYKKNKRDLPWRHTRDPYSIWISEVMLQQTTATAVIPFYKNFLNHFPQLKDLAQAKEEDVLSLWTGLGYYSRARNLHKAAQEIHKLGAFPKTYSELIQLPGFGPYTSRAVSSFSFNEAVGVLDGNVIRFLSRYYTLSVKWWNTSGRLSLQEKADHWASSNSSEMNQALMEIGSTLCTPKNPSCLICPVYKTCKAFSLNSAEDYPLKKEKVPKVDLQWSGHLIQKKLKGTPHIALVKNDYAPFLKGQWILPGSIKTITQKPKKFDFKHNITKYNIFVQVKKTKIPLHQKATWVPLSEIKKWTPSSLIQKSLNLLSFLPFLFLNLGCQSDSKKNTPQAPSPHIVGKMLTNDGSNSQARFSKDSKKLIFTSRFRSRHQQAQIYTYDFILKKTQRVTYQLGENHSPHFSPHDKNEFYYASTTDEEKELSPVTSKSSSILQLAPLPEYHILPYDIYRSSFIGTRIKRITQKKGWDSQVQFIKKNSIIFTQKNNNEIRILQFNLKNRSQKTLVDNNQINLDPEYSLFHKKLLWITWTQNLKNNRLFILDLSNKKNKTINTDHSHILTPSWHPQNPWIIYSFKNKNNDYDIEMIHIDKNCKIPVITQSGDDLWPHFSPDGQQLVYSNNESGHFQLYMVSTPQFIDCPSTTQ